MRPGRHALTLLRSFSALGVLSSLSGAPGCGGASATGAPGADPQRQSLAEYDIAQDLWLRRNEPRKALEHALEAHELDDENADAAHLIGLLYLDFCRRGPEECRLDEAARFTRRAVEVRPDYREAKNTLGVILIHQKKYDEAVTILRPLTEDMLYQTPENAWGNLGWAYLEKGSLPEAVEALQRSVAAQPAFCVGHYRLGLALERKKDDRAAIEAFGRALSVEDPGCRNLQVAYAARGRAEMRLGQKDQAAADFERCVQLDKRTDAGRECGALLAKLK